MPTNEATEKNTDKQQAGERLNADILNENQTFIHRRIQEVINNKKNGITKAHVARILGIDDTTLVKIAKRDTYAWPFVWVQAIAKIYNVNLFQLTGNEYLKDVKGYVEQSGETLFPELYQKCVNYANGEYKKMGQTVKRQKIYKLAAKMEVELEELEHEKLRENDLNTAFKAALMADD